MTVQLRSRRSNVYDMSKSSEIEQLNERKYFRAEARKRRDKVAQLYLRGMPVHEIAELLDVPKTVINTDIQLIHRAWRLSRNEEVTQLKWNEIKRIDNLERHAWESYEMSKQIKLVKSTKVKGLVQVNRGTDDQPRWVHESPAERGQVEETSVVGDIQWMKIIMWCIAKRCEILGLDAPVKTDNTHTLKRSIGDMSDDELYESIMARRNLSDGGRALSPHLSA